MKKKTKNTCKCVPKRYIRDGQNPFEFFNDWEFKRRFRFSKNSVMFGILPLLEEGLARTNNNACNNV